MFRGLIDGGWTGTMNLTEPQAGLGPGCGRHPRRAVPAGRQFGCSAEDLIHHTASTTCPDIIHLVLARTPEAPEGVRDFRVHRAKFWLRRRLLRSAQRCVLRVDRT